MSLFIKYKIKPKRSAYRPDAWIESKDKIIESDIAIEKKQTPIKTKVDTFFNTEWADSLTPWAFYPISKYQNPFLIEALPKLHKIDKYDIVLLKGGVMKQTIHKSMGGKRANGTEPTKQVINQYPDE